MKSKKRVVGRNLAALLVATVLCGVATSAGAAEEKTAAAQPQGLPVEVITVAASPASEQLEAVGTVLADESVVLVTEIAGKVAQVQFAEGQVVRKGEVLLRIDDSVLAAERDRAAARVTLSAANDRRAENLLRDQAISTRERDEARAELLLDEAALRLAEAQLAKATLTAPFSGILGLRQVSVGGFLQPGTPVTTLDAIDTVKVEFRVPEGAAANLHTGSKVLLSIDAAPGETFSGEVYAVQPRIDVAGRSIALRARVPNPGRRLLPGMFARVRLVVSERSDVLFVPEEALIPGGNRLQVYKVVDGKVEAVEVTIGQRRRGAVEVRSGLVAGETVITAGHIKVRPGMPVTALPAAARE